MSNKYHLNGHSDASTMVPNHGDFLATFSSFEVAKRNGIGRLMNNEWAFVTIEDDNEILWQMSLAELLS